METHGNPIIDWQQNHAKKNHNNLQTFPPNPRRFGEHEPLQENPISVIINLLQSIYIYHVFPYQFLLKIKLLSTGKPIAFPWFCRQVPELNGLVGRSLGLASGCARRRKNLRGW